MFQIFTVCGQQQCKLRVLNVILPAFMSRKRIVLLDEKSVFFLYIIKKFHQRDSVYLISFSVIYFCVSHDSVNFQGCCALQRSARTHFWLVQFLTKKLHGIFLLQISQTFPTKIIVQKNRQPKNEHDGPKRSGKFYQLKIFQRKSDVIGLPLSILISSIIINGVIQCCKCINNTISNVQLSKRINP